jgi:hypothetical protein
VEGWNNGKWNKETLEEWNIGIMKQRGKKILE